MPPGEAITTTVHTTPSTGYRLPDTAGEVSWQATINQDGLLTLKLKYPDKKAYTLGFGKHGNVSVTGRQEDGEILKLSTSEKRQILAHARIISGPPLQLALQRELGTHSNAKQISDDALAKIAIELASNGLEQVSTTGRAGFGAQNLRIYSAGLVHTEPQSDPKKSSQQPSGPDLVSAGSHARGAWSLKAGTADLTYTQPQFDSKKSPQPASQTIVAGTDNKTTQPGLRKNFTLRV